MAQAVPHRPLFRSAARLARVPASVAFGLRFAIAASAAIWIGHLPGLVTNEPQWILITVLVVMEPVAGGSVMTGILRSCGTLVAGIAAIVLFGLFSQDPPLLLAGLFLTQALGGYGFSGPRYQYAWFVFAFTTAIVLGDAMTGTGRVETIAFQRATMVGIGVLIVLVVDSLLWPSQPEASLRRSLAVRARRLSNALGRAIEAPLGARDAAGADRPGPSPLAGQLGLASAMNTEIGASRSIGETLTRIALLLEALASRQRVLARTPGGEPGSRNDESPAAGVLADLGRRIEAALSEAADALAANRAPSPHTAELERTILRLEAERVRAGAERHAGVELRRRSAALRDLVALLRTLEEALAGLASDATRTTAAERSPALSAKGLQIDPFRVQIALRSGIAVCAAFVANMALGWQVSTLVAPIAFMIASAPTQGGAIKSVVPLAGIVLFGWLLADLALVFFSADVGRVPAALAYAFAVAGVLAYLTASRPQLAALRKVGSLLALLPVYAGAAAPTDVYGSYSTACYFALALAIGWVSTRIFWPATAVALFRERAAAVLAVCRQALRASASRSEAAVREPNAALLLNRYVTQLAQLGGLHAQARYEAIDGGLDEARRAELLALTQDLFDAVLWARRRAPEAPPTSPTELDTALAPLTDALAHQDEALVASMNGARRVLREGGALPPTGLEEAGAAVDAQLDALRGRGDAAAAVGARRARELMTSIDERRLLAVRQLAIEAWLADWQRTQVTPA